MTSIPVHRRLGRTHSRLTPTARSRGRLGMLFVSPSTAALLLFIALPIIAGFVLSFTQWDMLTPPEFVGIRNYVDLVHDALFWRTLLNTVYYAVLTIPVGVAVSLFLAMAVNHVGAVFKVYRTMIFIPVVASTVSVSVMWKWIYNDDYGLANWVLNAIGLPSVHWLTSPHTAMPAVAVVAIWKSMGYNMVILLAGLQAIPVQLYEAARIDGAGFWQTLWNVTIPMVSPTLLFVVVMSTLGSFQVFDQVFVMTEGGPGNSTNVLNYYLWQNAFKFFKMGYASALAYVLFLIILGVTVLQIRLSRRRVVYEQG